MSTPGVLPTYSDPRFTISLRFTSYTGASSNFTRKSMEFWCGGFHLYTRIHTLPLISPGGATPDDRGVNTRPSVSYSNCVSRIRWIASSIAAPSPAKNSFVSIRNDDSESLTKSAGISRMNCVAVPSRDDAGFFFTSSSVVNSGRDLTSRPL